MNQKDGPTTESVAAYISKLAGADAKQREAAAYELFRALAAGGNALLTVGLAVRPVTFEAIRARFGRPQLAEVPSDQDALEFELGFAHGVRLDVITPRAPGAEGPIAKFLARFGEGIQQVECDVRDVAQAAEIIRQRFQLEPVYPQVRAGANRTRVNFFLVPIAENRRLLIELVEWPKKQKG
jgi:hypothetical protein